MKLVRSACYVCLISIQYATVLAMLALVACGPATATKPPVILEAPGVEVAQEPAPYPLTEPGPYHAGKRTIAFEDASRDNRRVSITVWYPAVRPEGSSSTPFQVGPDRAPDLSGAPYPLILSSTNRGSGGHARCRTCRSHRILLRRLQCAGPERSTRRSRVLLGSMSDTRRHNRSDSVGSFRLRLRSGSRMG